MILCGKNFVELERLWMTLWHVCIACSITKSKNTHSDYVIFIAFPIHQLLQELASMLCHSTLRNTCLSQLLSDPQLIYICSLQYHCSGKVQHVSAFCLLPSACSLLLAVCYQWFEIIYVCTCVGGFVCVCVCVCIYTYIHIYKLWLDQRRRQVTSVSVNTLPTQL